MSPVEEKPVGSEAAASYVVAEGKKRGSTREVRMAAREDRWYRVAQVHAGDAILTDNWHTDEVLSHLKSHFEGHTFAERTLEAWGARVEDGREDTAYYTAGGRVWVLELVDAEPKGQKSSAASNVATAIVGETLMASAPRTARARAASAQRATTVRTRAGKRSTAASKRGGKKSQSTRKPRKKR